MSEQAPHEQLQKMGMPFGLLIEPSDGQNRFQKLDIVTIEYVPKIIAESRKGRLYPDHGPQLGYLQQIFKPDGNKLPQNIQLLPEERSRYSEWLKLSRKEKYELGTTNYMPTYDKLQDLAARLDPLVHVINLIFKEIDKNHPDAKREKDHYEYTVELGKIALAGLHGQREKTQPSNSEFPLAS